MRFLQKTSPPDRFVDWLDQASETWQPVWEGLQNPVKWNVKETLRAEQGDCCAYCGARLVHAVTPGDPDSLKHVEHIEHLVPRATDPGRALDWANLVLSCGGETGDPAPSHKHCGHAKGDWYDANSFVGPTDRGCEEAFRYRANGSIGPGHSPAGKASEAPLETIARLNLDCARLRRRRKAALQGLLGERFEVLDDLEPRNLQSLVASQDRRDDHGRLPAFGVVLRQVLLSLA